MFSLCGFNSGYFCLYHRTKTSQLGWIIDAKLPMWMCECGCVCYCSSVMDWSIVPGVSEPWPKKAWVSFSTSHDPSSDKWYKGHKRIFISLLIIHRRCFITCVCSGPIFTFKYTQCHSYKTLFHILNSVKLTM